VSNRTADEFNSVYGCPRSGRERSSTFLPTSSTISTKQQVNVFVVVIFYVHALEDKED
jgi:hypothetical protein